MRKTIGITILVFVGLLLESACAVLYINALGVKFGLINLLIANAIIGAVAGLIYLATRLIENK